MNSPHGIQLRDYQEAAIDHLYQYFSVNKGNPIVALPTGTGKSIVLGEFIRGACIKYPDTRVMMLTHVKELIEQNMGALLNLWPTAPAGIYSAGLKKRVIADVTFAGIQSVHKKPDIFGHVDLVVIDECHLVSPKSTTMYRKFLKGLRERNEYLKVVGFSATPFRLGQGMLTDTDKGLFDDVAFDLTDRNSFNWLIEQGWLAPLVPRRTAAQLDVEGVKTSGGEFILKQLQEHVDRDEITIQALRETVTLAEERDHWLIFASGIEHAEQVKGAEHTH